MFETTNQEKKRCPRHTMAMAIGDNRSYLLGYTFCTWGFVRTYSWKTLEPTKTCNLYARNMEISLISADKRRN